MQDAASALKRKLVSQKPEQWRSQKFLDKLVNGWKYAYAYAYAR